MLSQSKRNRSTRDGDRQSVKRFRYVLRAEFEENLGSVTHNLVRAASSLTL
jgi:hypothetical protein